MHCRTSSFSLALGCAFTLFTLAAAEQVPDRVVEKAARSVHLFYPAPEGTHYYQEMVVNESVNGSYFMACGWNTGYFGIQQLGSPEEKIALFSVWDAKSGADNPNTVSAEDRVEVLHQGDGVKVQRFGGEGSGGQSKWPFPWKLGETNRFLVEGIVEGEKTRYTAWIAGMNAPWKKLATFRVVSNGSPLKGYYSFVEDFRRDGKSADERRRATYSNGWVQTVKNRDWVALTRAQFTADSNTLTNINAGAQAGGFYLATGGTTTNSVALRSTLDIIPTGLKLPDGLHE